MFNRGAAVSLGQSLFVINSPVRTSVLYAANVCVPPIAVLSGHLFKGEVWTQIYNQVDFYLTQHTEP